MEKGTSGSSINVVLNSLRFMMEEILRKRMKLNIRYSKTPKKLPVFLSKREIFRLIEVIPNKKHKLLVSLMYGTGLRVSEAVKLKPEDIDFEINIGWVRHGKGNKDRPFILPSCLRKDIYDLVASGRNLLFEGRNNKSLSVKSVQVILNKAAKKAGIEKNVHPHALRHSFATHLLESGNDIITVQSLLGHNESRTTMTYLHVARPNLISIKSPLDDVYS